jgi:hypothetical protein
MERNPEISSQAFKSAARNLFIAAECSAGSGNEAALNRQCLKQLQDDSLHDH